MEKRPVKFNKLFIIIPVALLLLVAIGLYLAGLFSLPATIESAYQGKDCNKVQRSTNLAARFYPGIVKSHPEFPDYSTECGTYLEAQARENDQEWEAAHEAYQVYEQTYLSGIMAGEVHEHQGQVLVTWAKQQAGQKQYSEAIDQAKLVLADYADTASAADAEKLFAETYIAWAASKRSEGDFTSAEALLIELKTWAQDNSKKEYLELADQEMAETLLAWGLDLTAKQEFTPAEVYLERAIETAPDTEAGKDIAAQASVALSKLYIEWGTSLIPKENFEGAIEHLKKASELAPADGKPATQDLLADVYIQWAADLSGKNEFVQALEKIDQALASANTDASKQAVKTAQQDTYTAFGNSDKSQAQEAMDAAAKLVCAGKIPDLPIFGTDPEAVRAYLYPSQNVSLSKDIQATTPASMHYVACIVEVKNYLVSYTELYTLNRYYYIVKYKIIWEMAILHVVDGKIVSKNAFVGDNPSDKQQIKTQPGYNFISGPVPSIVEIVAWIESVVRQIK